MQELDPRLHAFRPDLADASLRGKVDAPDFVTGHSRQVVRGRLYLRKAPRADAGVVSELLFGETVKVFEDRDGWAWLQNATDGYVGYADSAGLGDAQHTPTHSVAALRTWLYTRPDLKSPPVDLLSMNAPVRVEDSEGGYSRLVEGGWVWSAHLANSGSFDSDHAEVALRFLGTPYLWGGRTSIGIDCSGLVQMALARCGKAVPRDSDMQEAAAGTPVSFDGDLSALRRGDLVFWPGHCGILLANREFVHANATDMMVSTGPLSEIARHIERVQGDPIRTVLRP